MSRFRWGAFVSVPWWLALGLLLPALALYITILFLVGALILVMLMLALVLAAFGRVTHTPEITAMGKAIFQATRALGGMADEAGLGRRP